MNDHRRRFTELYEQCSHLVLGYALRRVDDPEDAADVVSETFVVLWRRLDEAPPPEQIRPWLYGVARRVLANQRRSRRRRAELDQRLRRELAALGQTVVRSPEGADTTAVAAAFAALPERDREVLALTGWEGLNGDELAVALRCSRGTARVRLHRARGRFAKELTKHGVDPPQRSSGRGHHSAERAHRPFTTAAKTDNPGSAPDAANEHGQQHEEHVA